MSKQTIIGKSFKLSLKCDYCMSETIAYAEGYGSTYISNIYYHGVIGKRYTYYYAKFNWEVQCSNLKCDKPILINQSAIPIPVIQKLLNRQSNSCHDHNGLLISYIKKQCIGIVFLDGNNSICDSCHNRQFFLYKDFPPEVVRHL